MFIVFPGIGNKDWKWNEWIEQTIGGGGKAAHNVDGFLVNPDFSPWRSSVAIAPKIPRASSFNHL